MGRRREPEEHQLVDVDDRTGAAAPMRGLEIFFRNTRQQLFRVAMRSGASTPDQANDAVSDAMVDLCRNWFHVDEPRAWAMTAVKNNLIKIKKREARQHQTAASGYATPEANHDPRLNEYEELQIVRSVLNDLPPAQRTVISLVMDGHRPVDIAAATGASQSGVRKNLERARTRLRDRFLQTHAEMDACHLDDTSEGGGVDDRR